MTAPGGGGNTNANVVLNADVSGYQQNMGQAQTTTDKLLESVNKLSDGINNVFKSAGRKLELFSAGSMAGIAGAVTSLAKLQSAMSQVSATAALTGNTNVPLLTRNLVQMSTSIPASTQQLAALATTIQGLGVTGTGQITKLTETFTKLGAATGESSQGLASNMIQLTRSMGQAIDPQKMQAMASAVANLSAKLGTSATGITQFAQAIEPMGRLIGLTQTQILGLSGAFAKAGADSGPAYNAFNQLTTMIINDLQTGNPQIRQFADLLGESTSQFTKMAKNNPAEMYAKLFTALQQGGPRSIQILQGLGLDGVRTLNALQRVAQGGGLQRAFGISEQGAADPSRLNRAAGAAMSGLGDQMTKIGNSIKALVSGPFETLLSVLTKVASGVADVLNFFEKLANSPIGHFLGQVAGIAATILSPLTGIIGAVTTLLPLLASLGIAFKAVFSMSGVSALSGLKAGLSGMAETSVAAQAIAASRAGTGPHVGLLPRFTYGAGSMLGSGIRTGAGMLGVNTAEEAAGVGLMSRLGGRTVSLAERGMAGTVRSFITQPAGALVAGTSAYMRGGMPALQRQVFSEGRQPGLVERMGMRLGFFGGRGAAGGGAAGTEEAATGLKNVSEAADETAKGMKTANKDMGALALSVRNAGKVTQTSAAEQKAVASAAAANAKSSLKQSEAAVKETEATAAATKETQGFSAALGAATKSALASAGTATAKGIGAGAGLLGSAAAGVGRMALGALTDPMMLGMVGMMALPPIISKIQESTRMKAPEEFANTTGTAVGNLNSLNQALGESTISVKDFTGALKDGKGSVSGQVTPARPFSKEEFKRAQDESFRAIGFDKNSNASDREKTREIFQTGLDKIATSGRLDDKTLRLLRMSGESLNVGNEGQFRKQWQEFMQVTGGGRHAPAPGWLMGQFGAFGGRYQSANQQALGILGPTFTSAGSQKAMQEITPHLQKLATASYNTSNSAERSMKSAQFIAEAYGAIAQGPGGITAAPAGMPASRARGAQQNYWMYFRRFGAGNELGQQYITEATSTPRGQLLKQVADAAGLDPGVIVGARSLQDLMVNAITAPDKRTRTTAIRVFAPGAQTQQQALQQIQGINWSDPKAVQQYLNQIYAQGQQQLGTQTRKQQEQLFGQFHLGMLGIQRGTPGARAITGVLSGAQAQQPKAVTEATYSLAQALQQQSAGAASAQRSLEDWVKTVDTSNPAVQQMIANLRNLQTQWAQQQESTQQLPQQYRDITAMQAQVNLNAPGGQDQWNALQQQRQGLVQQGVQTAQQYLQQMDQLHIQIRQGREDLNKQQHRQTEQFNLQERRSQDDFNLQTQRSEQDFHIQMARQTQQYNIQVRRSNADYRLQERRSQQDFNIQMAQGQQDYNISRFRAQRDFNYQASLYVKQFAQSMSPWQQVQAQDVTDAGMALSNLREQSQQYQQAGQQLRNLRQMGLSQNAIDVLGLSDPNNIQQLNRFYQDVASNPKLVDTFNRSIKDRLKWTKGLATDKSNTEWRQMEHQFNQAATDAENDFERSTRRAREAFSRQMSRAADDFQRQMDRSAQDYQRMTEQANRDFHRQLERNADDFARQTRRSEHDFDTQMGYMKEDYQTQVKRMLEAVNHIATNAYGTNKQIMDRALAESRGDMRNYFRNVRDMYTQFANDMANIPIGGGGGGGVGTGAAAGYTGRAGQIAAALSKAGYSATSVAGILGNLKQESQLSPTAGNLQGGPFGIAQWQGSRLEDLKRFAQRRGKPVQDLETQIAFLLQEAPSQGAGVGALNRAGSAQAAASAWNTLFERSADRPGVGGYANRMRYAQQFYQQNVQANRASGFGSGPEAELRRAIVAKARTQLGTPYHYVGEEKPGVGFDCSGLIQWLFRQFGIKEGHYTYTDVNKFGHHIPYRRAKPGDVVYFGHPAHHVALFLGGTKVEESPQPGGHVQIRDYGPSLKDETFVQLVDQQAINRFLRRQRQRSWHPNAHPDIRGSGGMFQEGSVFSGTRDITVGEGGPEAVIPLNERGADFVLMMMKRANEQAWASMMGNKFSSKVQPTVQNTHINQSTNFTGAVHVTAQDPNQMANALKAKARLAALTNPDLAKANP